MIRIPSTAAKTTIVQSKSIVDVGDLDPETIITPGIFVQKVIEIQNPEHESQLVENKIRYSS